MATVHPRRIAALRDYFRRACDTGRVPGLVVRIAFRGEPILHEAFGSFGPGVDEAMPLDAVFRVKSMTKLVTSLAALRAAEEGRIALLQEVADFLPAFGEAEVLAGAEIGAGRGPLAEPLRIYHLLTHTSGLSYGQCGPETARLYKEAGLYFDIDFKTPLSTVELADRLAALPLAFQPGTRWAYSWGADVVGRILEVAYSKPLSAVFREAVLDPLGLSSIGFDIDPAERGRLVPPPEHDRIARGGDDKAGDLRFLSGGEGLLSTAEDWGRLVDAIILAPRGRDVLSPRSVDYMLSDHVGPLRDRPDFPLQPAYSFGMGSYVRVAPGLSSAQGSVGEFGWWGSWGTAYWGDPAAGLSGVLMMQQPDESRSVIETVKFLAYAALPDPAQPM